MAQQRISLLTLIGWDNSPVVRFSPLPAGVTFTLDTDVLVLTPAGSTFNALPTLQGRLPTAAELAGAPYYHMHIRGSTGAGAPVDPQDVLLMSVGGELASLNVVPTTPVVAATTLTGANTTTLLIPAETETVSFVPELAAANLPYLFDYTYSIPQEPTNRLLNEPMSVEEMELYSSSPLETVFGAEVNLANGAAATPLVPPTEAQLDGAPWYYLSARIFRQANPPVTAIGLGLFFNGSAIPSEWLTVAIGATPAEQGLYLPYPERISPDATNLISVDPMYTRLSADAITAIDVQVPAGLDDLTVQYSYLIPVLQDQPTFPA